MLETTLGVRLPLPLCLRQGLLFAVAYAILANPKISLVFTTHLVNEVLGLQILVMERPQGLMSVRQAPRLLNHFNLFYWLNVSCQIMLRCFDHFLNHPHHEICEI